MEIVNGYGPNMKREKTLRNVPETDFISPIRMPLNEICDGIWLKSLTLWWGLNCRAKTKKK